jgi:hypothetical protein
VSEERIISIIERGIEETVFAETRRAKTEILGEVQEILRALRERRITPNIAYDAIYGVVRRYRVSLTPRDIGEIKRLLGVA